MKPLNFIVCLYSAGSRLWLFCAELASLQHTLFILECCLLLPLLLNTFRNYLLLNILPILRLQRLIRHGANMLILKIEVALTALQLLLLCVGFRLFLEDHALDFVELLLLKKHFLLVDVLRGVARHLAHNGQVLLNRVLEGELSLLLYRNK